MSGYGALMRELGIDPLPMLHRYAITLGTLDDPEALVSLESVIRLLEESAVATGCLGFGLRLADRYDAGLLGLAAIVIQNAPTVAQAIADAARYLCLHSPAFEVTLDKFSELFKDCVAVRFEIRLSEYLEQRQTMDACIGHMVQISRLLSGNHAYLRGVSLPHAPLASESLYRSFFGVPVFFAQPYAALHLDRMALSVVPKSVNPMVRQLALDHIAKSSPSNFQSLTAQVRHALKRTLGAGRGTKLEVAELLGMHPRTLQRRLERENGTFEAIREQIYKEAALRYLRETRIPLKQLAGALGFSEQSAFNRSCRRWFNATPGEIRTAAQRGRR